MNENPEGMPNPLNPNPGMSSGPDNGALDANPSEPMGQFEVKEEIQVIEPVPTEQPMAAAPAATDPLARPMEQAPVVAEPPKKKKTGLIIGIIIAAIVLIGGAVAAVLVVMNMHKEDAVMKAIEKVVSGEMPSNVAIDGTIAIDMDDEESIISGLKIELNSEASTTSTINSSTAMLSVNFQDGKSLSAEFDEIYAANGDLYIKTEGLTAALEDYLSELSNSALYTGVDSTVEVEDCAAEDEDCVAEVQETEEISDTGSLLEPFAGVLDVIETIDGEWLRVSMDEITQLSDSGLVAMDSNTSCMVDFVGNIKNYSNSVAGAYNKNAFISSTTEGVTLTSKNGGPVYQIVIDADKFSSFVSTMQSTDLVTNLFSCMGYSNSDVNTDNVVAEIDNLPTIYVETDKDYNFTRLYLEAPLDDGYTCACAGDYDECNCEDEATKSAGTLTVDLGFKYPSVINIAEPVEYTDFSDMIQEILTTMYTLPYEEAEVVVTE